MLNAADHQMERPIAVQISWLSGRTESTRAACRAAEQALGECLWQLSKERVLFQGATSGIQTVPRVTRLKLVQPRWRGLVLDSCSGDGGSLCRLSLGAG